MALGTTAGCGRPRAGGAADRRRRRAGASFRARAAPPPPATQPSTHAHTHTRSTRRYEKYDATFKERKEYKDDPFMEEHDDIEMQVEQLMAKSEEVAAEQNRAIAASMNAEIRKAKAAMLTTGVEGLQKKLKKGKNVTKTIVEARQERLKKLIDSIYGIPDGMGGGKRGRGAYSGPGKGGTITLSSAGATGFMNSNPAYYEHSDATKKFDSARPLLAVLRPPFLCPFLAFAPAACCPPPHYSRPRAHPLLPAPQTPKTPPTPTQNLI